MRLKCRHIFPIPLIPTSTDRIADTQQSNMRGTLTTCTMVTFIINTATIGMNAPSPTVLSIQPMNMCTGRIADMLPFPMAITSITSTTVTYTLLMAITGMSTKKALQS